MEGCVYNEHVAELDPVEAGVPFLGGDRGEWTANGNNARTQTPNPIFVPGTEKYQEVRKRVATSTNDNGMEE